MGGLTLTSVELLLLCLLFGFTVGQYVGGKREEEDYHETYFRAVSMASCQAQCYQSGLEVIPKRSDSGIILPAGCLSKRCMSCFECFGGLRNGTVDVGDKSTCLSRSSTENYKSPQGQIDICSLYGVEETFNIPYFTQIPSPEPVFHCSNQLHNHNHISRFTTYLKFEFDLTNPQLRDDLIPRTFVVEKEVDGVWDPHIFRAYKYWLLPVETLQGHVYRFKVTAIAPSVIYEPRISQPISSFDLLKRTTHPPQNARVVKFARESHSTKPMAFILWESGSGHNATCRSNIHVLPQDHDDYDEPSYPKEILNVNGQNAFTAEITDYLDYGKNYLVKIIEYYGNSREQIIQLPLHVPPCYSPEFEPRNGSRNCPILPPEGVKVQNETENSFQLKWSEPEGNFARVSFYHLTVYVQGSPGSLGQDNGGSELIPYYLEQHHKYNTKIIYDNASLPASIRAIWIKKPGRGEKSSGSVSIRTEIRGIDSQGISSPRASSSFKFKPNKGLSTVEPSGSHLGLILGSSLGSLCLVFGFAVLYFAVKNFRLKQQRRKQHHEYFENLDKEPIQLEPIIPRYDDSPGAWEIDPRYLAFGSVIGEGAFGLVRKAVLFRDGRRMSVAVKTLRGDGVNERDSHKFWEEFDILKGLEKHRNVVELIGVVKGRVPALVVEFCPGGDLQTHLRRAHRNIQNWQNPKCTSDPGFPSTRSTTIHLPNNFGYGGSAGSKIKTTAISMVQNEVYLLQMEEEDGPIITESNLLKYARDIAVGMDFLARNKIIHRDLAARNILIGKNHALKIADFGLSRDVYEQNLYKKNSNGMIPIKWLAIECLLKEVYTTKSDVWSYGILLWEIVTFGGTPYPGVENTRIFDLLKMGYRMPKPEGCTQELYGIMLRCWDEEPALRPDFYDIRRELDSIIQKSSPVTYINLEQEEFSRNSFTNEPYELELEEEVECPEEIPLNPVQ